MKSSGKEADSSFPRPKGPGIRGWYHLPLRERPTFAMVVAALKEAEWRMPTEDYGVILIYDLPIEVQRELYPQLEFDEDGYRYRVRAVYVYRVKAEVPEPDMPRGA